MYYLAIFYEANENLFKAANLFNKAINKLGGEKRYFVSDENGNEMASWQIYSRRAKLYAKADEKEFACEDYHKALELIKDEDSLIYKDTDQKALEEKIKTLCN